MKVLDLFSGIGGFSLGLERAGMETVAFCEIEEFPRKVLHKHWPNVPIFEDVRELRAEDIAGPIDVICGGFPCQPFSLAGKRQGKGDDRHLWPEMFRLVQEIKPTWVIGENVPGLISMGLDTVLSELESEGYETATFIIPACAVNAPHRRDRVWIVANNRGKRAERLPSVAEDQKERIERRAQPGRICDVVADTDNQGPQGRGELGEQKDKRAPQGRNRHDFAGSDFERITRTEWTTEPPVCSRDDGLSKGLAGRVAKLKALGNSVVPQIPELIGRAILKHEQEKTT